MNKQELAEWIAENVLGWEHKDGAWYKSGKRYVFDEGLVKTIYSTDGFFAVWDAVREKGLICVDFYYSKQDKLLYCELDTNLVNAKGSGKDRYEAFYNAVYEAMK